MTSYRVEIANRESVNVSFDLENGKITNLTYRIFGGYKLIQLCKEVFPKWQGQSVQSISVPSTDISPSGLMLKELILKIQGHWTPDDPLEEICHCRKILRNRIDEMVVLGAHTPEKVKAWCSAGSGCGTCRDRVLDIISKRLKA